MPLYRIGVDGEGGCLAYLVGAHLPSIATVLQLLPGEDEPLLILGDTLLVLDLRLDVIDRVREFNLESDRLASEGLDKYLHTTTKAQNSEG